MTSLSTYNSRFFYSNIDNDLFLSLISKYKTVPAPDKFFTKIKGDELYLRDIFHETKDIPMVVIGVSKLRYKVKEVKLDELVPSQPTVLVDALIRLYLGGNLSDSEVINLNGIKRIVDGHHRLSVLKILGLNYANVKLFNKIH